MSRLYFDHNATAPPAPGVTEAMARALREGWGNPSSSHAEGARARAAREQARGAVAGAIGVDPEEVIFTSGGSEADALALRGAAGAGLIGTLVIGGLEHPAIARTARDLARREGLSLVEVAPDPHGRIDAAAVAAFGKLPLSRAGLGADLISLSAHKIGGPPGVGALLVPRDLKLAPYNVGGEQERALRPGTEPLTALVGFGHAARQVAARVTRMAELEPLRSRLERQLVAQLPAARIAGAGCPRLPNTTALLLPQLPAAAVVAACDLRGLSVSAGSACHGGEPSPVLAALDLPASYRQGLVRFSFGPDVTAGEIDDAAAIAIEAIGAVLAAV